MKMCSKVLVCLMIVSMPGVFSRHRRYSRIQTNMLSKTKCDLMCFDREKEVRSQCRSQCRSQEVKPGTCPVKDSPKWAAACVEACNSDSQCDGTQRCCHQGCGSSCSEPVDLLTLPGLPAMPSMEEPKERKKAVLIRWSGGVGDLARAVPGRVMYVVEEQHHLGPKYDESMLGQWNILTRTNKTKVSLRNLLKPGRWYRFRVAAVSVSGTRGFSVPSAPFTPRKGPRAPPQPKKLKVRPLRMDNGTVTVRLEWKEPRSDLPVMRYKVFWSRRLRGINGELDSVFVNHQTVPKGQSYLDIKDLQPKSMYFMQVQTISQFGAGKLRSEKAGVFYNTTSTVVNTERSPEPLQKAEKKIKGLKLNKMVWQNNKIKARISWEPLPHIHEEKERYYVNWRTVLCENPKKLHKNLTAVTELSAFELYELDYKCSYVVHVNKLSKVKIPDSELFIHVPSCESFKQKINGTTVHCYGT